MRFSSFCVLLRHKIISAYCSRVNRAIAIKHIHHRRYVVISVQPPLRHKIISAYCSRVNRAIAIKHIHHRRYVVISVQPPLTPQFSVKFYYHSLGRSGYSTRCTLLLIVLMVPYTQYGFLSVFACL